MVASVPDFSSPDRTLSKLSPHLGELAEAGAAGLWRANC